jgi:hypothetical protein
MMKEKLLRKNNWPCMNHKIKQQMNAIKTVPVKQAIFLFLLLLLADYGYSQRFDGGILGGFNGTQVEGDTYKGYHKPGILAGVWVQTDMAPAVFAAMELKFSQKGARNKIDPKNPVPEKYIMRLDYADLPVYLGFRTNDYISLVGGITFGYLLRSAEINEDGPFPPADQKPFNSLDLQPFLGFQFDVFEKLKLDLRIAYSVLPVRGKPDNDLWYWRQNQFNNVLSMAVYYQLGSR